MLAHQTSQNGTSGLLKCGNLVKCRTQSMGRPAAESNLSLKSRSFLNGVNDRLRKMLDRSPEDSMQDIDKRSVTW